MLHRTVKDVWGKIKGRLNQQEGSVTQPSNRRADFNNLVTSIQAKLALQHDLDHRGFLAEVSKEVAALPGSIDSDQQPLALFASFERLSSRDREIYNLWLETKSTQSIAEHLQIGRDDARATLIRIYADLRCSLMDVELS